MTATYHGYGIKVFDYSHTAAPDYYVEHRHTLVIVTLPSHIPAIPDIVLAPGHYLKRYLVDYQEHAPSVQIDHPDGYRVYTRNNDDQALTGADKLLTFVKRYPGIYVEVRSNALLAFRPDRDMENSQGIEELLEIIDTIPTAAKVLT